MPWFDNLTTVEQEISFTTVFILLIQASVINKVREIYSKTLGGRFKFNSQENEILFALDSSREYQIFLVYFPVSFFTNNTINFTLQLQLPKALGTWIEEEIYMQINTRNIPLKQRNKMSYNK